MNKFCPVVVIPVYNHGSTLMPIACFIQQLGLPLILVDDGSNKETKDFIEKIALKFSTNITVVTLDKNSGKGKAVMAGIRKGAQMGFSHVLQMDADGQHDNKSIIPFLQVAQKNPAAMICGYPEYDRSVPLGRKLGRKITNGMIFLETWSFDIRDALCGFRVYPVEQTLYILEKIHTFRMGFDLEVIVKICWEAIPVISLPVKVTYPKDGISNFRMFWDNVEISKVHTALFIGMIRRKILHV